MPRQFCHIKIVSYRCYLLLTNLFNSISITLFQFCITTLYNLANISIVHSIYLLPTVWFSNNDNFKKSDQDMTTTITATTWTTTITTATTKTRSSERSATITITKITPTTTITAATAVPTTTETTRKTKTTATGERWQQRRQERQR